MCEKIHLIVPVFVVVKMADKTPFNFYKVMGPMTFL